MGIYSIIDDVLFALLTISYESNKIAFVTMGMLNMHTMAFYKSLKAFFAMTVSSEVMFVMR